MPGAPTVPTQTFMRCFAVLAMTAGIFGGCYGTNPVVAPKPTDRVHIEYRDPRPDLVVATAKHGVVVLRDVHTLDAQIQEIRSDSIVVRVLSVRPDNWRVDGGTSMIAKPAVYGNYAQTWTQQKTSRGQTVGAALGFATLIGLVLAITALGHTSGFP